MTNTRKPADQALKPKASATRAHPAITFDAVIDYLDQREQTPAESLDGQRLQAKAIALALVTGATEQPRKKANNADIDATLVQLANIRDRLDSKHQEALDDTANAEGKLDHDESDHDGIDDPRTEADVDSPVDPELDDEGTEMDADHSGDEGEGDEPKAEASVVKGKYRKLYKQNGNPRGNNDWLQNIAEAVTHLPKKRLNVAAWLQILDLNKIDGYAKYMTADKQTRNGWVGQLRMNTGIQLRNRVADNVELLIPASLWDEAAIAKANAKLAKAGLEPVVFEILDDVAGLTPPKGFVSFVMAKRKETSEAGNASRRRKAKGK